MGPYYTKLFHTLLTSTVWREPLHVKVVWVTMLCLRDRHGRVLASIPGIAHQAGVTIEEAEDAIARFLAPDPYSRSREHDGRRIEELPDGGGWTLLNHGKYSELVDAEIKRENAARRQARKRAKRDGHDACYLGVTSHAQSRDVTLRHAESRSVTLESRDVTQREREREREREGDRETERDPEPEITKQQAPPKPPTGGDVPGEVWSYWLEVRRRYRPRTRHTALPDKDRKRIREALKAGLSADDLKLAIEGLFLDPFYRGDNDRQRDYIALEYVLRRPQHFIDLAERERTSRVQPAADPVSAEELVDPALIDETLRRLGAA